MGSGRSKMAKPISIYELEGGPNQFFSPFCWAARFAVAHKGLPIETIRWKFKEGDKIAFSNQGLVPVIVDGNKDGKWVNDSWAIAKYLEETYPDRPSLFGGPQGEAAALFVQKWFQTGGPLGALFKIVILDIYKAQTPDLQPWFRETREAKFGVKLEEFSVGEAGVPDFQKALEPLRQLLAEYPYLGGKDGPSYADHFVAGMFMLAYAVSSVKLLEKDDVIYAWRERMMAAYGGIGKNAVGHPESL
ncbi:g7644 [Coccomyxa elongata]